MTSRWCAGRDHQRADPTMRRPGSALTPFARTSRARSRAAIVPSPVGLDIQDMASRTWQDRTKRRCRSIVMPVQTGIHASYMRLGGDDGHASRQTRLRVGILSCRRVAPTCKQWHPSASRREQAQTGRSRSGNRCARSPGSRPGWIWRSRTRFQPAIRLPSGVRQRPSRRHGLSSARRLRSARRQSGSATVSNLIAHSQRLCAPAPR